MKITKFTRFLVFAIVAGLIAGCDPDNIDNPSNKVNGVPGEAAYMSVNVSLPSAGGAQNAPGRVNGKAEAPEDPVTEVGLEYENTVKSMLLILADKDNNYCASGVVENMKSTGANLNVAAKFDQTHIGKFYDEGGELKSDYKPTIRVFVFCNPTQELLNEIKFYENETKTGSDWTNLDYTIENKKTSVVWGNGTFLMSNYSVAERQLPALFSQWTSLYTSADRAFDLSGSNGGGVDNSAGTGRGPIRVERSVARFDFKDGSNGDNTYDIGADGSNSLKVQLVRMALVNMSKKFYYLRHMYDEANGTTLLNAETADNYVWDTDAQAKRDFLQGDPVYGALHDLFEFPLFNTSGKINDNTRTQWDSYKITDVLLKNGEDNPDYTSTGYHIWRYVTENAMPSVSSQVAGLSTGVVFKGKLLAGSGLAADSDLKKAIEGTYTLPNGKDDFIYDVDGKKYPVLFMFQNNLYVGWESGVKTSDEFKDTNSALHRAVIDIPDGSEKSPAILYNELIAANYSDEALAAFRKAATAAGFTLYQASNDNDTDANGYGPGYYFYYYYWNRHRNNGEQGQMGPMEFAAVRNNVYKLSVTKISKIGYPRIQDNNPDPVDPEDPDENSELYITVSVEVLPWVVRENNIEF